MTITSEHNMKDHLISRAGDYFQELRNDAVDVQLRSVRQRISSTLYEFDLVGRNCQHTVLVKCPRRAAIKSNCISSRMPDRPRICSQPPLDQKSEFEYLALAAIESHLAIVRDDRFAAVRMLDLLPDGSALVMEKASGRNLLGRLFRASRFSFRRENRDALIQSLRNAGAWLKSFHQLPPLLHTRCRCNRCADFVDSIEQFTNYLSQGRRRNFCQRLGKVVRNVSQELLPDSLPSGLNHGDYAPANILSERCGRIRIIDTQARWQAPIYEDLAKFLFGMKVSQQQVWSLGHAYKPQDVVWFERQFLEGYFGAEPIPFARIRLFECQAILERWVALVHASRAAGTWKRWIKDSRRLMWEMFATSHISETLRCIEEST